MWWLLLACSVVPQFENAEKTSNLLLNPCEKCALSESAKSEKGVPVIVREEQVLEPIARERRGFRARLRERMERRRAAHPRCG
jgi:hypothetical protein